MKLVTFTTKAFKKITFLFERIEGRLQRRKMISLQLNSVTIGNVLISYLVEPFTLKQDDPIFNRHTQYWECLQMARTFLEMGYISTSVTSIQSPSKDTFCVGLVFTFIVLARKC